MNISFPKVERVQLDDVRRFSDAVAAVSGKTVTVGTGQDISAVEPGDVVVSSDLEGATADYLKDYAVVVSVEPNGTTGGDITVDRDWDPQGDVSSISVIPAEDAFRFEWSGDFTASYYFTEGDVVDVAEFSNDEFDGASTNLGKVTRVTDEYVYVDFAVGGWNGDTNTYYVYVARQNQKVPYPVETIDIVKYWENDNGDEFVAFFDYRMTDAPSWTYVGYGNDYASAARAIMDAIEVAVGGGWKVIAPIDLKPFGAYYAQFYDWFPANNTENVRGLPTDNQKRVADEGGGGDTPLVKR